jgi:hypothetical protein
MPKKDLAPEETLADEQESLGMHPAYKPALPPRSPVPVPDPNFDRPWRNDIRLPNRGFLKGVMHFVNKNTDNLARSVFDRVVSSAKFAGCVNNYSELRRRYRDLMELEASNRVPPHSIKFINYYTASTGRKKSKKEDSGSSSSTTQTDSAQESPSLDADKDKDNEIIDHDKSTPTQTPTLNQSLDNLSISESVIPNSKVEPKLDAGESSHSKSSSTSTLAVMDAEPIPETTPETQSPERTTTLSPTETLRQASLHLSETTSSTSGASGASITTTSSTNSTPTSDATQKLRKFILLPKNHWKYHDNAHWTAVVMQDIDEVEAHQSMFIPSGAHYDPLVGETVSLIEAWVQDELSRRLARESLD